MHGTNVEVTLNLALLQTKNVHFLSYVCMHGINFEVTFKLALLQKTKCPFLSYVCVHGMRLLLINSIIGHKGYKGIDMYVFIFGTNV